MGFDAYPEQHGCTATAAASLITGHAFNGGLRYDCDAGIRSEKVCVKQQVSCVGDAAKRAQPGTLPMFTRIALDTSTPALARTASELVPAYLTGVVGLDPARLRVTTSAKSSDVPECLRSTA